MTTQFIEKIIEDVIIALLVINTSWAKVVETTPKKSSVILNILEYFIF